MRTFIALLLTATVALGQQGSERDMQLVCPAKTAAQINTAITEAGTDTVTFGFDGGEYTIDANVSFPSNISIRVYPGSTFAVSSGKVMDFNTNAFVAEATAVFTGAGTATGKVSTLYRWLEWGDTTDFNIGEGSAGGVSASANNTYDGGTVQAFALATATNLSLNGVAIDSWGDVSDYITTSNYFGGYPQITLTTNMITIDHASSASDVAITNATFVNAFDNNTNTYTSIGKLQDDSGTYTFDLGAIYRGIFLIEIVADPVGDNLTMVSISPSIDLPTYNGNVVDSGALFARSGSSTVTVGNSLGRHVANPDNYRFRVSKSVEGRYMNVLLRNHSTALAPDLYKFSLVQFYGVTL